ncbi:hypothetical protein MUK42_30566 [Musa troglodytarum]|uniref:DUF6737 domain-containing protein n=1 Tax=Musa troglodytarum TaxID=320322 RepID=A0A9E7FLA1_9LILI|nr:hypothetical protein MUK42_30566 [Musa troglodytarum]URD97839.1 hypothetical protein MUK42_30566 [Musa troglodytarum]
MGPDRSGVFFFPAGSLAISAPLKDQEIEGNPKTRDGPLLWPSFSSEPMSAMSSRIDRPTRFRRLKPWKRSVRFPSPPFLICSAAAQRCRRNPPRTPTPPLSLPGGRGDPHQPDPLARGPRGSFRMSSNINGEKADESRFFDEDGVVEDMDGYLNYLSLEYDSVWDTKPSWCQPWTILLTGVAVVACSWTILHSAAISIGLSILICGWWYIFLYAYPKAYSDMITERRKKVSSGMEDTFGIEKKG